MIFSTKSPRFSLYLEGSGKVGDTAHLMRCLYNYWLHKGFWGSASASVVNFLNAFAILLVTFLFTMRFQWSFAMHCASEQACASQPLMSSLSFPYLLHRSFLGHFFGFVLLSAVLAATVYEGAMLVAGVHVALEVEEMARGAGADTGFLTPYHRWQHSHQRSAARASGHETVGLRRGTRPTVSLMAWGDFLEMMCDHLSSERRLKRCDGGIRLDALLAVQALLQRDNFLIALYDSDVLRHGGLRYMSPEMVGFLVSSALDACGTVHSRDEAVWRVRERAYRYAMVNILLFPFVAAFSVVKLLVKNAGQFKENFREFAQYDWNDAAHWRFRLYNEVPYLHASRLADGRDTTRRMTEHLAVSNNTRHLLRRVSSTCILVTMLLTFLNPSLFIGGSVGGLTLVWWLTLGVLVFSAFSTPDPREREYVYLADLERLVNRVHYCDSEWGESGESFNHHITTHLFQPRLLLMLDSLLRTLAAPFVLCCSLRDGSVSALVEFMRANSVVVDGVGSVPCDAVFEQSARDASDDEESSSLGTEPTSSLLLRHSGGSGSGSSSGGLGAFVRTREEKVRQSIASFCAVYPGWMLAHVDEVRPGTDRGNAGLRSFVQGLHARVHHQLDDLTAAAAAAATTTNYNNDMPCPREGISDPPPDEFWEPQFSARSHYGGGNAGGVYASAVHSALPSLSLSAATTHERERLFVSQVRSACMDRPAPHGPRAAAVAATAATATASTGGYGAAEPVAPTVAAAGATSNNNHTHRGDYAEV